MILLLQNPFCDLLHFAVIGQPRTGKTTFIDALRNLKFEKPEMGSLFQKQPLARYNSLDDKVQFIEIQTDYYNAIDPPKDPNSLIDEFVLVIDDRTETGWIQDQVSQCAKLPVIVRSKVQLDILNYQFAGKDPTEETDFLSNLKKHIKANLDVECHVFLVDSFFQEKFEFQALAKHLLRNVIGDTKSFKPRRKQVKTELTSCNDLVRDKQTYPTAHRDLKKVTGVEVVHKGKRSDVSKDWQNVSQLDYPQESEVCFKVCYCLLSLVLRRQFQ